MHYCKRDVQNISRLCPVNSNFLLCGTVSFISKHQASLALPTQHFPIIPLTRNHPQIFPKRPLGYGAVPIKKSCFQVALRQSDTREKWDLEHETSNASQWLFLFLYSEGSVDPLCLAASLLPSCVLADLELFFLCVLATWGYRSALNMVMD